MRRKKRRPPACLPLFPAGQCGSLYCLLLGFILSTVLACQARAMLPAPVVETLAQGGAERSDACLGGQGWEGSLDSPEAGTAQAPAVPA